MAFSAAQPGAGSNIRWAASRVEAASNGSLKLRLFEPDKLVAPFEILDAVSSGKVEAGYSSASLWAGKMPASRLFSTVPFGPEAGEFLAWLWHGNGAALYQGMYDQAGYDVKVLVCGILPPKSAGWFAKEVNQAADLRELNMRFFGIGGDVMRKLGVSVRPMAGSEIISAVEKVAIEAVEYSTPEMDRKLGIHKHLKINYFPGWHQQASMLELLINKAVWNNMHVSQQLLLDTVCRAASANSFAEGEARQYRAMQENTTKDGVTIRNWSSELLAMFEKSWQEVAREQAAADPYFKKVWEDLSAFRADYAIWRRNAFLPRAGSN